MSQSKRHSLIESLANTAAGFAISMMAVAWIWPLFGIRLSIGDNFIATAIMTVVSIARGYVIRRWFNRIGRAA